MDGGTVAPEQTSPHPWGLWLEDYIDDAMTLCAQHGGKMTFFRGGALIPKMQVTVNAWGEDIYQKTFETWETKSWKENVWTDTTGEEEDPEVTLTIDRVQQPYEGRIDPGVGTDSETSNSASVTAFSNGASDFTPSAGSSHKNNAMSWILAEMERKPHVMPGANYINIAFWALQNNPNAVSGTASTEFFTTSSGASSSGSADVIQSAINSINDEIKRLRDEMNAPGASDDLKNNNQAAIDALKDQKKDLKEQIAEIETQESFTEEDEENGYNYGETTEESASGGTNLYNEALIFGKMWQEINGAGGYENGIIDQTDIDNIHVQFHTEHDEDFDTYYIVGPFKLKYIEYYTSLSGDGAQFCGMTGKPELTVLKDGNEIQIEYDDEWKFAYAADGDFTESTFSGKRADFPNIPEKYNLYPHSGEEFYLKIKYQEGIHKIARMKFNFRYMEAEGSYNMYEGNQRTIEWTATVTTKHCASGKKCSHGEEGAHDYQSGTTPTYTTCPGGSKDHPCAHGSEGACSEQVQSGTAPVYSHCDGGTACEHGYYHAHYVSIDLAVNAKETEVKVDVQDDADVQASSRKYVGVPYGADIEGSGGGPEKEFEWEIDLTTTLMGWVWNEVQEVGKDDNGALVGRWDKGAGQDAGVKNVEVTVFLYKQEGSEIAKKSTKREKAIMHTRDGERVEFPLYTDDSGKWNHEDYVFEAPGSEENLFYVVEFQYDGQFFKDTVQLASTASVTNYVMEEQDCSHAYDEDMNMESAERSKAVTEVEERKKFDESFGEITGDSPMDGIITNGKTITTDSDGNPAGEEKELIYEVRPSTEINNPEEQHAVISRLDEPMNEDDRGKQQQKFTDKEYYDRFRLKATTYYNDTPTYGCEMEPDSFRTKYPKNKIYWMDNLKFGETHLIDEYMRHLNLGLIKRPETDLSTIKDLYKVTVVVNEQKQVYKFNPYGLTKSKYVELETALENVRSGNGSKGYSLGLYESDVAYSSMLRYKQAIEEVQKRKKNSELRVFATYVIRLYNNSMLEDAEFKEVRDFYDEAYTVVQEGDYDIEDGFLKESIINDEMKRETTRLAETPYYRVCSQDKLNVWGATKEENLDGFSETGDILWEPYGDGKSHKTSSLKGIKIDKNEYIEIFTTYEVDKAGYDAVRGSEMDAAAALNARLQLINKSEEGKEHKNTAEISSYSTYYGPENVYRNYKVGWVAGRVDKDSAPNNIRYGDREGTYEDDTFEALLLKLKFKEVERELTGLVFEDKKTEELTGNPANMEGTVDSTETFKVKVGDGKFDSAQTDIGVKNVEVSLYEVINLGELDDNTAGSWAGLEYYYKVPDVFYGGPQKTGDDGTYKLDGFLAGDYVVRFDYGKNADAKSEGANIIYDTQNPNGDTSKDIVKYNGQDYENTKFLGEFIGEGNDSQLNMKFLPIDDNDPNKLKEREVSKARDNESRRLEVISYSRTIENERAEALRNRTYGETEDTIEKEFVDNTKMFAETPIIKIEVEDPAFMNMDKENNKEGTDAKWGNTETTVTAKTEPDNNNTSIHVYEYGGKEGEFSSENLVRKQVQVNNIDFGLEERARTDLELKTFVNKISIFKADETIFQINVNDDGTLNYDLDTSRSRKVTTLPSSYNSLNQQGFFSIEMENDFLNGLELVIRYKIEVLNNSEIDFTSRISGFYRQDVLKAYAQDIPTSTFYEDVVSDYKKVLKDPDTQEEITLSIGDIGTDNVYRLNSNAIKEVFEKGYNLKNDSKSMQAGGQIKAEQDSDTIKPEVIVYGLFTGRYYYENKILNTDNFKNTYTIKDYLSREGALPIEIEYERDKIVRTTVNRVVDYVDIDGAFDLPAAGYIIDKAWTPQGEGDKEGQPDQVKEDANGKITYDDNSYKVFKSMLTDASFRTVDGDTDFYDYKDRKYVDIGGSNIGFAENDSMVKMKDKNGQVINREEYSEEDILNNTNSSLSRQLEPAYYVCPSYMDEHYGGAAGDEQVYFQDLAKQDEEAGEGNEKKLRIVGEMYVGVVKRTASSQDADEINIDNLAEVLVYSNSTGRRDVYSVPGNALAIGAVSNELGREEKSVWYSGYNSLKNTEAYGRNSTFAFRNLIANSARSTPDNEWPNGKINEVTRNWMLYPEDDQWAPEYIAIIPPTGLALRSYLANNLPQVIAAMLAVIGLGVLFIYKQIRIRRNKNKF